MTENMVLNHWLCELSLLCVSLGINKIKQLLHFSTLGKRNKREKKIGATKLTVAQAQWSALRKKKQIRQSVNTPAYIFIITKFLPHIFDEPSLVTKSYIIIIFTR